MALFTSQNAREMAALSAEARRRLPLDKSALPAQAVIPTDDYPIRRLSRVRAQLNTLDTRLEAELKRPNPDTRKIKETVEAQVRLAEQERILAGRPTPGQRKPKEETAPTTNAAVAWLADAIDLQPEPQVVPPAAPKLDPEPALDTPTCSVPSESPLPETPSA